MTRGWKDKGTEFVFLCGCGWVYRAWQLNDFWAQMQTHVRGGRCHQKENPTPAGRTKHTRPGSEATTNSNQEDLKNAIVAIEVGRAVSN